MCEIDTQNLKSDNTCNVIVREYPHITGADGGGREGQSTTLAARFWSKVDRRADAECWPWLAHLAGGYGRFKVAGRYRQASAIAWELAHGRGLPAGRLIRHTCDNSRCVNPAHLRASTQKHNVHDAIRKGRHVHPDWRLRITNNPHRKVA